MSNPPPGETLLTADYDFALPPALIAQHPASPREAARLLCVGENLAGHLVADLPDLLRPGDLLVANDTRVIPAQLSARRGEARIGITLDRPLPDGTWHALARNARRLRPGDHLHFDGAKDFSAAITSRDDDGGVTLRFDRPAEALSAALAQAGALALPPTSPARKAPPRRTRPTTRPSSRRRKAPSPPPRPACISPRRCSPAWPPAA